MCDLRDVGERWDRYVNNACHRRVNIGLREGGSVGVGVPCPMRGLSTWGRVRRLLVHILTGDTPRSISCTHSAKQKHLRAHTPSPPVCAAALSASPLPVVSHLPG